MMTAVEFGTQHGSCSEAMEWRRSLPTKATQADAWLACERGEWLLWQLSHGLTAEQYDAVRPAIKRALDHITERAILRAHLACVDAEIEIPEWEIWAFDAVTNPAEWSARSAEWSAWSAEWSAWSAAESAWSAAESAAESAEWSAWSAAESAARSAARSAAAWSARSAESAARLAARSAARSAEQLAQADDIRAEIPTWPGTED